MRAIQPLGYTAHQAYTRMRPGAQGFALPGQPGGAGGASSAIPLTAMQGLLGLQELRASAGMGHSARVRGYAEASGTANPQSCWPQQDGAGGGFVAAGYGRYIGRSAGSGQCVALVQATNPEVGRTRTWAPGAPVQGNTSLTPGTVIATFNSAGRYANATDGSSHAAIYLGQDERGIQVMDQWAGKSAAVRTIPWSNPGGSPANTASSYSVVTRSA